MVVIHGTARFRARLRGMASGGEDEAQSWLGAWSATMLRRRPEVALFVNESTLLPVLVAMAPARTLLHRFPVAVADLLAALRVPDELIEPEIAAMAQIHLAPTADRSVVGGMNEFARLAAAPLVSADQLLDGSVQLAATPCGPLYQRHVSPDRELAALVAERSAGPR